jgi:hypothetical protein
LSVVTVSSASFLDDETSEASGGTNVRLALVLSNGVTRGLFSFTLRYRLSVPRSPPSAAPTAQVAPIRHAALSVPLDGRLKSGQHQRKFPRGWGHDTLMLCSLHNVGAAGAVLLCQRRPNVRHTAQARGNLAHSHNHAKAAQQSPMRGS